MRLPRAVASYDLSPNGICKILLCSPGILRPPMAKASYGLRWPPMASGILMPSWYHIASSGAPLRLIYGLEPRLPIASYWHLRASYGLLYGLPMASYGLSCVLVGPHGLLMLEPMASDAYPRASSGLIGHNTASPHRRYAKKAKIIAQQFDCFDHGSAV